MSRTICRKDFVAQLSLPAKPPRCRQSRPAPPGRKPVYAHKNAHTNPRPRTITRTHIKKNTHTNFLANIYKHKNAHTNSRLHDQAQARTTRTQLQDQEQERMQTHTGVRIKQNLQELHKNCFATPIFERASRSFAKTRCLSVEYK